MKHDPTFSAVSAYGSPQWAAATLGRSYTWLRDHRTELEAEGFPPKDTLTGYYVKADVLAWIRKRRRISDSPVVSGPNPGSLSLAVIPGGEQEDDDDDTPCI